MRKRGLADHAQRAPALDESFKSDYLLLVTESLIKAVEARLDRKPAAVEQAMSEGYILTAYFAEQLPAYLKQEQAMRFYYPDMIAAIDLKREDARLASNRVCVAGARAAGEDDARCRASRAERRA